MRFWNLATRREVARFEMKSVIHSIAFAPNGSALFVSPQRERPICPFHRNLAAAGFQRGGRETE